MIAKLTRDYRTELVTLGTLIFPWVTNAPILQTLERPWKDNVPDISCIPLGLYDCIPHDSLKHPDTYEITSVPGRSECLLHIGNYPNDSLGCILLGLARVKDIPMVQHSESAMNIMRSIIHKAKFQLEITEI